MAKVTPVDIIDLGFAPEMFRRTDESDLADYIESVITEQSAILEGRIGAAAYASISSPAKDYVKRAEKCLTAAELVQRRINIILNNSIGAGMEIDISHEGAQKKAYKDEANMWIDKIISGMTSDGSDFVLGVLETDHFEATNA